MSRKVIPLTVELVTEWAYRYGERLGMLCEDRRPSPTIEALATSDANEWLTEQLQYSEIDKQFEF